MAVAHINPPAIRWRKIGPFGSTARIIVGALLLGSVAQGHLARGFHPSAWALGLVGIPAVLVGLQALRGYAGCEVLAVSNWLLQRDDQVGCALFWPADQLEHHRTGRRPT
jgi:hypothetical protein